MTDTHWFILLGLIEFQIIAIGLHLDNVINRLENQYK